MTPKYQLCDSLFGMNLVFVTFRAQTFDPLHVILISTCATRLQTKSSAPAHFTSRVLKRASWKSRRFPRYRGGTARPRTKWAAEEAEVCAEFWRRFPSLDGGFRVESQHELVGLWVDDLFRQVEMRQFSHRHQQRDVTLTQLQRKGTTL